MKETENLWCRFNPSFGKAKENQNLTKSVEDEDHKIVSVVSDPSLKANVCQELERLIENVRSEQQIKILENKTQEKGGSRKSITNGRRTGK